MAFFETRLFELLRTHPEAKDRGSGASIEQIADAQRRLRVSFPEDYVAFLSKINGVTIGIYDVYGIDRGAGYLDLEAGRVSAAEFLPPVAEGLMLPVVHLINGDLMCFGTEEGLSYQADATPRYGRDLEVYRWSHEYAEEPSLRPFEWRADRGETFLDVLTEIGADLHRQD